MFCCVYCGSANCDGDCQDEEECEECGNAMSECDCHDDDDGEPDEPDFDPAAADAEAERHFSYGRE